MPSDPHPDLAPFDPPPRFRWVPPLMIGLALGGALGCVVTFAVTVLAQRSQAEELVAEQFNISTVLNAVPGTGDVTHAEDMTDQLGRLNRRGVTGSAVRRKIRLVGSLPKGTAPSAFAQQLKAQIDAELGRQGAFQNGGMGYSSGGGNEARVVSATGYTTRDGRQGYLDLDLVVRDGQVEGTLILTEGR
jgi:hypothetical protein